MAVAGLTALAFALRVPGMGESLFGDELYSYAIVTQASPGRLISAMQETENNPPLFFLFAWATGKIGDPTVWMRLPSLVLGTAAVPLTYLLGVRTVGRRAGMLGAALLALSPPAIFFSSEARAYAPLILFSALSTLLLLNALDRRTRFWWLAYVLGACLLFYTHYSGVLVVAAQAVWALRHRREQARQILVAHASVGAVCLAWLPFFLDQETKPLAGFTAFIGAPALSSFSIRAYVISFSGHPFVPLRDVPGRAALVLLGLAVLTAIGAAALRFVRSPTPPMVPPRTMLLVLLTVATPLGILAYSLVETNIFVERNMLASLPALCLLLGTLFAHLPRTLTVLTTGAALLALAIGAARVLDSDSDRPPYRQAAELIDSEEGDARPVVDYPLFGTTGPLSRSLELYFKRTHRHVKTSLDAPGLAARLSGARSFRLVTPWVPPWRNRPLPEALSRRYRRVETVVLPSWIPVGVLTYVSPESSHRARRDLSSR